jgi:hypothetical protein
MRSFIRCQLISTIFIAKKNRRPYGAKSMDSTEQMVAKHLSSTGGSQYHVKLACPCIDRSDTPLTDFGKLTRHFIAWVQTDPFLVFGLPVADAYHAILEECLARGMTHVVTIESDMIVPRTAVDQLLVRSIAEGRPFVCGSYVFKDAAGISVALDDSGDRSSQRIPEPFRPRGLVVANRALPMGCAVIDLGAVRNLPRPLFRTLQIPRASDGVLEHISQDTYFTSLLRLHGHTPMLDTSLQCVHVSRQTGECFGSPDYVVERRLRADKVRELAVRDDFLERHPPA